MKYWIATASADHIRRGIAEGFMQVCHGKTGPLARTRPKDRIAYYSPTVTYRGADRLQAFTAIGEIRDRPLYAGDMGGGFTPARRDVDWWPASETPIRPLLDQLDFTRGRTNWGAAFRYGLFSVSERDFDIIANAMQARVPSLA